MRYTILKNVSIDGRIAEPGEVIDLTDEAMIAKLLEKGTIQEVDASATPDTPTPTPTSTEQPSADGATAEQRPLEEATSTGTDPSLPASETVTVSEAPMQPAPEQVNPNPVELPTNSPNPETVHVSENTSGDLHIS